MVETRVCLVNYSSLLLLVLFFGHRHGSMYVVAIQCPFWDGKPKNGKRFVSGKKGKETFSDSLCSWLGIGIRTTGTVFRPLKFSLHFSAQTFHMNGISRGTLVCVWLTANLSGCSRSCRRRFILVSSDCTGEVNGFGRNSIASFVKRWKEIYKAEVGNCLPASRTAAEVSSLLSRDTSGRAHARWRKPKTFKVNLNVVTDADV